MNVLAAGGYGYGNFGDECYVDILQSGMTGCKLDAISRVNDSELRLHSYDLSMLAGGGLLYHSVSESGDVSLKHYLKYPAIAQWLNKKSFLIGLGVQGPLQAQHLAPYIDVLEGMDLRTVRDSGSAQRLRDAGVCSSVLECADLFYAKTMYSSHARSLRIDERKPGKPVLGVVVSQPGKGVFHPEFEGFECRFQQALRVLEKDFNLHFFSFDSRADSWLAESWTGNHSYTRFDMTRPDAIRAFIQSFETVDAFVTTRFHGALLSITAGTPFLAIGAPGEKLDRECEAIRYPQFLSYASTADQFAESASAVWAERVELRELLQRAAPQRRNLAMRNFELMATEMKFPERNGARMISHIATSILDSAVSRTLVIWAAGVRCWQEASGLFNQLPDFDCVLPPNSKLQHSSMDARFLLPNPGIFNWAAFPDDLKRRLAASYDNVIVCHTGTLSKAKDLLDIAIASGARVWEFDVWKHSIHFVSGNELAARSAQHLRSEEVLA